MKRKNLHNRPLTLYHVLENNILIKQFGGRDKAKIAVLASSAKKNVHPEVQVQKRVSTGSAYVQLLAVYFLMQT